jgi:hypothetical protein
LALLLLLLLAVVALEAVTQQQAPVQKLWLLLGLLQMPAERVLVGTTQQQELL